MKKLAALYKRVSKSGGMTIPAQLRRSLNIQKGDGFEIVESNGELTLKPYQPRCVFCDSQTDVIKYKGKHVCPVCVQSLGGALSGRT